MTRCRSRSSEEQHLDRPELSEPAVALRPQPSGSLFQLGCASQEASKILFSASNKVETFD